MAATLGSIMAADISLLVQLGFAFVIGMLIDTFIVRPLLLPTFIILTRRTLGKAAFAGGHSFGMFPGEIHAAQDADRGDASEKHNMRNIAAAGE